MSSEFTEQQELDLAGVNAAEIATFNGDVTIHAGATRARLEVTSKGKVSYGVERLGNLLYVVARKGGLTYLGSGASFQLWLPVNFALKLATVNGAIHVQGEVRRVDASLVGGVFESDATGSGALRLKFSHGEVVVRDARGPVDATTGNGSVRIDGGVGEVTVSTGNGAVELANAEGRMTLKTGNGALQMRALNGQVRATTGNGPVQLTDFAGQAQVVTGNGKVWLENVTFAPGGHNQLQTGHGRMDLLGVHAPGGLRIHAKHYAGRPSLHLPGYQIEMTRSTLLAYLPGPNPADLEIMTPSEIAISN